MPRMMQWSAKLALFAVMLLVAAVPEPARATSGTTGPPESKQTDHLLEMWDRVSVTRELLADRVSEQQAARGTLTAHILRGMMAFVDVPTNTSDSNPGVRNGTVFDALAAANAAAEAAAINTGRADAELRAYTSLLGVQGEVEPWLCPQVDPVLLREGAGENLCARSVATAAHPAAARAIIEVFRMLGAPYACQSIGRLGPDRYDCSSLVTIGYARAGVPLVTEGWAPTTRDMFPWDGTRRASWATVIEPGVVRPGDLALYVGGTHHVVLVLADGFMAHTASCGDVAHVTRLRPFTRGRGFSGARRVDPLFRGYELER